MPAMFSITVKKADGTTNIVYDALASSGGDNSPAVWRQDTGAAAGLPVGLRPTFKMWTMWNGPKTARRARFEYVYPYAVQDTTTSLYSAKDRVVFANDAMTLPQGLPATVLNEAAAQFLNLIADGLIKSAVSSGYAPT